MDKVKRFFHMDFLIALIFRGSGVILTFLLNIILARRYGAEISGYYYIFYNFLALVDSVVFMGFGYVVVHKITPYLSGNRTNDDIRRGNTMLTITIYVLIVNAIIMMIVLFLFSRPLSAYLCGNTSYRVTVMITAFCIIPYTAMFLLAELLKALKKPNWSITCTNITINGLFVIMICAIGVEDVNSIMYLYLGANILSFVVMTALCVNILRDKEVYIYSLKKTKRNYLMDAEIYKAYLKENWTLTAVNVSNVILNVFDTIVIGSMLSSKDVALYSVANKVVSFGSIILTTVNAIIGYKIADLSYRGEQGALRKVLVKYTRVMFPLGGLYYIFAVAFSFCIPFLFGQEYRESVVLAILLAVGQLITIITGPCSYFMIMTGHTKEYQRIVVYTAMLTIVLNLLLVRLFGIWGSVITSIFTLTFKNVITFVFSKNSISLKMKDFIVLRED